MVSKPRAQGMAKRKTQAEKRRDFEERQQKVWEDFEPKLAALQNLVDAELLLSQSPPVDRPGRRYYSNLSTFLMSFSFPNGAGIRERKLYIQLVERLDAAGDLKPGAAAGVLEKLRKS
jgi:hypothetical protein